MSSRLTRKLLGPVIGVLLVSVVAFYWAERKIDQAHRAAAAEHLEQ